MNIIPYDGSESHAAFVFRAARARANDWPYTPADEAWIAETCRRNIAVNPRGCMLAVDDVDPDLFYGYVLTEPGIVTMAYTKEALRGPGAFDAPVGTPHSHPPVCLTLLQNVGIDPSLPTGVRIWSNSASRIAARGWRLYPLPPKK